MCVRKAYRRHGVSSVLMAPALNAAKHGGAPALEAHPLEASGSGTWSSTVYASAFARAGFRTVVRHIPTRPIMRHDIHDL